MRELFANCEIFYKCKEINIIIIKYKNREGDTKEIASARLPRDMSEQKEVLLLVLFKNAGDRIIFSSVQSFSRVRLFATPWTAARHSSLSITNSRSLLKLMSIAWVIPSNYLILCRPLLLPPSIFPGIRVFSKESVLRIRWPKYWSFSFSISS